MIYIIIMIINSQNRKLSNATSTQTKSHVESPLSNLEEIDRPVNFLSFLGTFRRRNHYGVRDYYEVHILRINRNAKTLNDRKSLI